MTSDWSPLCRRIADAVTTVFREGDRKDFGAHAGTGAWGVPSKQIDIMAERAVLRVVEETKAPVNVLSEEIGFVDRGADRTLVVDPIDGTTNAYKGIPFHCVALAVGTKNTNEVEYGLVKNLPTGDIYEAARGAGATRNGERIQVRSFDPHDALVSTAFGNQASPAALEVAKKRINIRSMGAAALELCLVADGASDAYFHGREALRIVDIAASLLILREAGGEAYDLRGARFEMPFDVTTRRGLLAVGDPAAKRFLGVVP
ncbi:MAG: inositol monophosphatase family protein [Methanobacteriota archaeon]